MKITKVTKSYFETEGERVYFFEPLEEDMSVKEFQELMDEHERYEDELRIMYLAKEIIDYKYEGIKFKLADNTFYSPDFFVVYPDRFEIIQIKGYETGRMAHSIVKFKVAREEYPYFTFKMIAWRYGRWEQIKVDK